MPQFKAIETRYKGYRFRSRLEARWAVFFDTIKYRWTYEPEGFQLKAGWYLPDFWLPEHKKWVEVKGGTLSKNDFAKCAEFGEERWKQGERFCIIFDIPDEPGQFYDRPIISAITYSEPPLPNGKPSEKKVVLFDERLVEAFGYMSGWWVIMGWALGVDMDVAKAAIRAARSARFEHGEIP